MSKEIILEIKDLKTSFKTFMGDVQAVRGISYTINKGEIIGVVGESGSGKTVSALSITKLLPKNAIVGEGEVYFGGEELLQKSDKDIRRIRNKRIAMIFQDSMTSLNPTMRIGKQIVERLRAFDKKLSKKDASKKALEILELVHMPNPKSRLRAYPFELSGGMRQRVMIAIAISCNPELLIADEPTTALDVTIQNQILKLLKSLRDDINTSIMLITHDLGVVAETCEKVIVMYGGMIMEEGTVDEIFYETSHPYTIGLKQSIPDVSNDERTRLFSIPGSPPSLINPPKGCPFAARCEHAMEVCGNHLPEYKAISKTHRSMCWLLDDECPITGWKETDNER